MTTKLPHPYNTFTQNLTSKKKECMMLEDIVFQFMPLLFIRWYLLFEFSLSFGGRSSQESLGDELYLIPLLIFRLRYLSGKQHCGSKGLLGQFYGNDSSAGYRNRDGSAR